MARIIRCSCVYSSVQEESYLTAPTAMEKLSTIIEKALQKSFPGDLPFEIPRLENYRLFQMDDALLQCSLGHVKPTLFFAAM